jgi:putative transposase
MGVEPLCRLFGKSRQAYYKKEWHLSDVEQIELVVLELIAIVRRELPGLGLHKLYKCIYQPLRTNNIKMGRDRLNTLMRNHGLLITIKRRGIHTTNSNHVFRRYPDLAKDLEVVRSEQLWVSDITYICISYDFNYLSLITDAYSKKIMGYCLHPYLTNEGTINALNMAIKSRTVSEFPLMHHSDRGVQYCSYDYVKVLNKEKINISMTQNGEAYENPIAERINGILKTEFDLGRVFKSRTEALLAVKMAIEAYNNVRPHMSCGYLTPVVAHLAVEPLKKCWKNTRKKKLAVPSV